MTPPEKLLALSRRWRLQSGIVVCKSCAAQQHEKFCDQPFAHRPGCDEVRSRLSQPWSDLNAIIKLLGP